MIPADCLSGMRYTFYVAPRHPLAVDSILAPAAAWALKGEVVQSTFSRRAFVTGLGMLSIPLIAFAPEKREEKKKEAEEKREQNEEKREEKKDEAKDKAEDKAEDRDNVVDAPGTDRSQDRRQDRRRDAVK